jgi:hypothetical protein
VYKNSNGDVSKLLTQWTDLQGGIYYNSGTVYIGTDTDVGMFGSNLKVVQTGSTETSAAFTCIAYTSPYNTSNAFNLINGDNQDDGWVFIVGGPTATSQDFFQPKCFAFNLVGVATTFMFGADGELRLNNNTNHMHFHIKPDGSMYGLLDSNYNYQVKFENDGWNGVPQLQGDPTIQPFTYFQVLSPDWDGQGTGSKALFGVRTSPSECTFIQAYNGIVAFEADGGAPAQLNAGSVVVGDYSTISTPVKGQLAYDTTNDKLMVYTGAWETVTSV